VSTSATKRLAALALLTSLGATACSGAATPSPAATNPAPGATSGASTAPASSTEAAPEPSTNSITLQGAGATFPAPLYQSWFEKYNGRYGNVQIDYQANGSGAGIKAITEGTVDFGASDAAMKDDEIGKLPAGSKIVHIPTALGAVVVIYNLPGISELNLDSANVAGIFLGTIKKWNDPAIAANNSGATLPDKDILVVHRSDGSGTTNAFTTYLDTVSPGWHSSIGKGKEVNWPAGVGAQGNDGVAGGVKQTEGAVGYVELNYATQASLASAKLKNADGQFVGRVELPGRLPPGTDHQRGRSHHLPDRVLHLPPRLSRPEGRGEGQDLRRLRLLGADRRTGGRARPRVRAAPGGHPAEGDRRASLHHGRRLADLAVARSSHAQGSSRSSDRGDPWRLPSRASEHPSNPRHR